MTYHVEQTTVDHVKGTTRVRVLPKGYRTRLGAEKAAQRLSYVVSPDGRTRVYSSAARVIERESHFGERDFRDPSPDETSMLYIPLIPKRAKKARKSARVKRRATVIDIGPMEGREVEKKEQLL